MRKFIKFIILILIVFVLITCYVSVRYKNSYADMKHKYELYSESFVNVSDMLCDLEQESLYIDIDNCVYIKELFESEGKTYYEDDMNVLFNKGVQKISKSGNAVFFYFGNKNHRAVGIAYFKYYFSTSEPKYQLITGIRALNEKEKNWLYYEQR